MKSAEVLFESYNMAVEGSYNKAFENSKGQDPLKLKEGDILPYIDAGVREWENTPLAELDGMTPAAYIEGISDFEQMIELFKQGAAMCDGELPGLFLEKLKSFGSRAEKELLELASGGEASGDEQCFYTALMAVRILGRWKAAGAVDRLLELLYMTDPADEIMMEELIGALVNIGHEGQEPVLRVLENAEDIGAMQEYLLEALVGMAKSSKSDRAYRCLKTAFRKMDNKMLGAIYLGNYGDGRAIPVLRGYVEKNRGNIDRNTYYEIKSAVQRLGGSMDDISL